MRRTVRYIALAILASWLSSGRVSADILIESYRGARPADADRILADFRNELVKTGVEVSAAAVISVGSDLLPLAAVAEATQAPSYPPDARGQVERGATQVLRGDYEPGLATLNGVLKAVRANPGLVITDSKAQTWLTKAYAAIAFAQIRTRHPDEAEDAIAEQIRSFPETPVGRIVGPEVATLAESVRKKLDAGPHGSLRISVSQPDVEVFLNEQRRAVNGTVLSLAPGAYRVVLTSGAIARSHRVVVSPSKRTDLEVDWNADVAFNATPAWVGFSWPPGDHDATELAVARYARAGRRHDILVVGISSFAKRRAVVGQVFEKRTGVLVRRKAIELDSDATACLRALAQYLAKGDVSPCLFDPPGSVPVVLRVATPTSEVDDAGKESSTASAESGPDGIRRQGASRFVPVGLVAGGAALLITGGVLITMDEDEGAAQPEFVRNTGPFGVGLAAVGAVSVAAGVTLYLWRGRGHTTTSAPVAVMAGRAAYLGWAGHF